MKFIRPGHAGSMEKLAQSLADAEPTYAQIGATLTGALPAGFRHGHYLTTLGQGDPTFERAILGLKSWRAHRSPVIRVFPAEAAIRPGETVVVSMGFPALALAAPCRIIEVIDEPNRWGFAYGTLPGHPEQGEEAFVVSRSPDGGVHFAVTAFSRPGDALVRLSGPIGRSVQATGTKGYLRALRRFVDQGT